MSADAYDECIKRLRKAGAGHPRGRVYHAAIKNGDAVNVFDVWTTQAAFDAFGKTLMPILQSLGVDPGQPRVMDVHNVIVAPARKTTARKPARRAPLEPRRPLEAASPSSSYGMLNKFAALWLRAQPVRSPVLPQSARAACSAFSPDVDADVRRWGDGLHS